MPIPSLFFVHAYNLYCLVSTKAKLKWNCHTIPYTLSHKVSHIEGEGGGQKPTQNDTKLMLCCPKGHKKQVSTFPKCEILSISRSHQAAIVWLSQELSAILFHHRVSPVCSYPDTILKVKVYIIVLTDTKTVFVLSFVICSWNIDVNDI